jgi:hypothetical protein
MVSEVTIMKLRTITFAIVLAGFAGMANVASAGQPGPSKQSALTIDLLSRATGLTVDEVKLALGPSTNYEYPVRYESANRRFRQAVGRTMYERIMGEGELSARQVQDLVAMARARQAKLAAGK